MIGGRTSGPREASGLAKLPPRKVRPRAQSRNLPLMPFLMHDHHPEQLPNIRPPHNRMIDYRLLNIWRQRP